MDLYTATKIFIIKINTNNFYWYDRNNWIKSLEKNCSFENRDVPITDFSHNNLFNCSKLKHFFLSVVL